MNQKRKGFDAENIKADHKSFTGYYFTTEHNGCNGKGANYDR